MAFHALFAETLWGVLREHLLDLTFPGRQDEEPPRGVGLRRQVLQFINGGQHPEDSGLHQNGTGQTQDEGDQTEKEVAPYLQPNHIR